MNAQQAASELFRKIEASAKDKRFAVFLKGNDEVQVTGVGTALFRDIEKRRARDLVGVYTREVRLEWLVADLVFMEMAL